MKCVQIQRFSETRKLRQCVFIAESQPYQEELEGAVGGDNAEGQGIAALRLDDDNEFPPMTHKNDWPMKSIGWRWMWQLHWLATIIINTDC